MRHSLDKCFIVIPFHILLLMH